MSANAILSQPSHSNPLTSNVSCIQAESQIGARSAQQDLGVQAKCQSKNQASTPANRNKNDRVPKNVNCPGNTQNEEYFEGNQIEEHFEENQNEEHLEENQNKENYQEAKKDDMFEKEFLRKSLEKELEDINSFSTLAAPSYMDLNMDKNFEYISTLPENLIHNQGSFVTETLEQKECFSKVVEENTVGRISLNSKQGKEHLHLKQEQLEHLNKDDQRKITALVEKYGEFWAKKSSSIGNFTGFKARLEMEDNSPCWQKERRMNLSHIEGIEKCIEDLIQEGVFLAL